MTHLSSTYLYKQHICTLIARCYGNSWCEWLVVGAMKQECEVIGSTGEQKNLCTYILKSNTFIEKS